VSDSVDANKSGSAPESDPVPATEEGGGDSGEESGEELESVEVITGGVDSDGNVIIDDLIAEVDSHGHIVATDEKITIETPQGDVIVDETFSVIGDDGELHAIDEELTVTEHGTTEPTD
jgi:hypothetical protein